MKINWDEEEDASKAELDGPAEVDVAVKKNKDGSREVTLVLPPAPPKMTKTLANKISKERGKRLVAVCDLSGEYIFDPKNVNEVRNPKRSKSSDTKNGFVTDGMILSTKLLRMMVDALKDKK